MNRPVYTASPEGKKILTALARGDLVYGERLHPFPMRYWMGPPEERSKHKPIPRGTLASLLEAGLIDTPTRGAALAVDRIDYVLSPSGRAYLATGPATAEDGQAEMFGADDMTHAAPMRFD